MESNECLFCPQKIGNEHICEDCIFHLYNDEEKLEKLLLLIEDIAREEDSKGLSYFLDDDPSDRDILRLCVYVKFMVKEETYCVIFENIS